MSDHAVSIRRSSGVARLFRGWTIAFMAVVLAAGGHQAAHSLMHGATAALPAQLILFPAALTAPIAVGLAGKRLSIWATACSTIVAQVAFHALYSLPYTGVSTVSSGHDHGVYPTPTGLIDASSAHRGHTAAAADTVMIAAHLLAAALTIVVIVHGERSLIALAHWLTLTPVRIVLATRSLAVHCSRMSLPQICVWIPHPMNVAQTRFTRGPPVLA